MFREFELSFSIELKENSYYREGNVSKHPRKGNSLSLGHTFMFLWHSNLVKSKADNIIAVVGREDYFSVRYVGTVGDNVWNDLLNGFGPNKVHNNDGAVTVFHTELQKNNCRSVVLIACCLYNTFYKWTIKIYILNFIKK